MPTIAATGHQHIIVSSEPVENKHMLNRPTLELPRGGNSSLR
ncbi:MAG: hypothetical protein ACJ70Q_01360 [Nitrososphaera sp.]